jgi:hypothetical protein
MALGLLLLGVAVSCGDGQPEAVAVEPPESTRRMAARLEALADDLERDDRVNRSDFFKVNSPWKIPGYQNRLLQIREPQRVANVRFALARELLWDGQTEAALRELTELNTALAGDGNAAKADRQTRELLGHWLAIAYLRLGEQRNCVAQHTPDSCLFPIEGGGIHGEPSGSRGAISALERRLKQGGDDLAARWLLNLAYMTLGEHPDAVPRKWLIPAEVFASEHDVERFVDVSSRMNANLQGLAGGAILEDFDGDGLLDIVASSWGLRDQLRYLHNAGDGTFSDRTRAAGLTGEVGALNLSHADYDNDGDADILVLRGGWLGAAGAFPNSLLRNDGDGTFTDVTEAAGLLAFRPSQTAAWADYDGDGWLDVFVGGETLDPADPQPCQLLHNEGDGTFTDRAAELGLSNLGFVKGATWGDYDNDGRPDLYLSRMGQRNLLFHNDGSRTGAEGPHWRFGEVSKPAGVREPRLSFPTWFWDYDNDGWLDLFVGAWDAASIGQVAAGYLGRSISNEHARLYHNERDGTFRDVTAEMKLDRFLLAMGANFGDIDNDGFLDVYIGTGAPDLATLMPNRMFRNAGGRVFQDVTTAGGFGHLQKGHGIAFGDVDNDGDQDIYAVMGGWYSGDTFQNALFANPGTANRYITLRLKGVTSNRAAVGARIELIVAGADGERHIHRTVGTGGSFGSSSLQQEIGLGAAESIAALKIRWPASGRTQVFRDVPLDRVVAIREDSDSFELISIEPIPLKAGTAQHSSVGAGH